MVPKLRGQGPRTFISYAVGNTLAPRLAQDLREAGFQVTLVDDRYLLGVPSLSTALERLIQEAEVVVPVLDKKANQSTWVLRELETAINHARPLFPVVQDSEDLPGLVKDIPYLAERNLDALIPAVLARYALLPLDRVKPYHLSEPELRNYLATRTRYIRVILDSENLTGRLAAAAPDIAEQVTRQRPDLREVIERQVREPLERAVRLMDRTQPVLPQYRATLEESLSSGRGDWAERARGSYQRLTRYLVGLSLLEVAETLPPVRFSGYWREAGESVTGALADCQNANLPDSQETREQWALTLANDDSRDGWVEVVFLSSKGNHFRGYFPDRGDLREMVRWQERPATYLDSHLWADLGLPQLVKRAAGSPARQHLESIVWSLRDYEKSGFP